MPAKSAARSDRRGFGLRPMAKLGVQTSASMTAQPAIDLDTFVRGVLFISVFLAAWISFRPFPDLSIPPQAVLEGGDLYNQIGYSTMFLAFAAWTYCHEPQRLLLLLRPVLIATVLWCVVSVAASWEPALAARRLAFALIVMSISGMVLLVPKNLAAVRRSDGCGSAHCSGHLLSRRPVLAAVLHPPRDGLPRARTCRQLARRVPAQERGRRDDGAVHLHRPLRRARAQPRARRPDRRAIGDISRLLAVEDGYRRVAARVHPVVHYRPHPQPCTWRHSRCCRAAGVQSVFRRHRTVSRRCARWSNRSCRTPPSPGEPKSGSLAFRP